MRHLNKLYIFMALLSIILLLSACQPLAGSTDNASAPADTSESEAEVSAEPADTGESEAEVPTETADAGESDVEDSAEPLDVGESEAEAPAAPTDAPETEAEVPAEPADTGESESEAEGSAAPETARTADEKIANAMSAGPAPIAQDAAILDYPEEWPGNWPDEPAPELVEIRAGSNGWTCIVDIPDTPGNDPMCLNDTYLEMLMAQRNLVDAPSTGVGFGYMLQGGGPVGSPPHMMVFVPESNGSFDAFGTEPGPFPWIMFPETTNQHLMVLAN